MRNKRKGILMASAILGSAAIVSTGFAAWVITINTSADASGTIDVDTVSDKTISVSLLTEAELAKVGSGTVQDTVVKFGASAKTITSDYNWLTPTAEEDLYSVIYVKVEGSNYLQATPFTFALTETSSSLYSAAVTAGYVTSLESVQSSIKVETIDVDEVSSTTVSVYKVTLTFAWGTYFNSLNPTNYYNSGAHDSTRASLGGTGATVNGTTELLDDVRNVLMSNESAYQKLANATFKLTITPNRDTSK